MLQWLPVFWYLFVWSDISPISTILELEHSQSSDQHIKLTLQGGKVIFLPGNSTLKNSIETHYQNKSLVEFELSQKNLILSMTVHYPVEKNRGGTKCLDSTSYHPKACSGFTIP